MEPIEHSDDTLICITMAEWPDNVVTGQVSMLAAWMRTVGSRRLVSRQWNRVICERLYPRITILETTLHDRLSDETALQLCNLEELSLAGNTSLSTAGLAHFTRLYSLSLADNVPMDHAMLLPTLSCLRALNLYCDGVVGDEIVTQLPALTELYLGARSRITDAGLRALTNLEILGLWQNSRISGDALKCMTSLTTLRLDANDCVAPDALHALPGLVYLHLTDHTLVRNEHLSALTRLEFLDITHNVDITLDTVAELPSLQILVLEDEANLDDGSAACLEQLRSRGCTVRGGRPRVLAGVDNADETCWLQ
jgi:Leucine-rich repeat (LRR) protein